MELRFGKDGEPSSSWFSLITENRALFVFIQLKRGLSERPVFFDGGLADCKQQLAEADRHCLECCESRTSLSGTTVEISV